MSLLRTVMRAGIGAGLLILALASAEAAVDPSLYQDLHWRLIGPFRGGRVLAVAGIPGNSRRFYFGAVDGGVWTTDDAGRTWRPIFDGEPVGSIGDLAIAPSDANTIYVGTGEADMRSDIAHGNGIYKTTDAGRHWSFLGLADSRQIGRILVDPHDPNILFVAALGHAYGPNAERGVFRSLDGGQHWRKVLFKDVNTGAIDLAFKPGDSKTIYAAMWQTRRPPWSVYPPSNGPGSGLYVSHDGGSSWAEITGNGFIAHPGRMGIGLSAAAPSRVYVIADGPSDEAGLYVSNDGGGHWTKATDDKRIVNRGWYFSRITVDPNNADRIYAMDTIVLRSDDGGRHFIALKGDPTGDDFHQMWIDPTNSDRQILGVDQGTLITLNGGKTWSSWYNQPTAQIYHVSTDNRFPYWVYGAQQDSGAVALPSRTVGSDGITMQQFHEVEPGGENGMIAPDPKDPHIVYGGAVEKLDTRTEQTRDVDPTLAYPALFFRGAWTLPLTFSRRDAKVLYFANQMLFRTSDGGGHWAPISPDLTRPDAGIPSNLDPPSAADDDHATRRRGVIYTIAPSPLRAGSLWVGTDDGLVWRTDDAGAHWRNVTPKALTPWSKVGGIELSRFDPNVAYLAIDRHRLDDDTPYIYRTGDGGETWARMDSGIPRDSFVNVVREDPVRRQLLYAGTEKGMYVSFDEGANWQSLQQNLPMTSVRDIDVHGDDLVIATHGRGFWIMDDVSPLRQLDIARDRSRVALFKPADAIRLRPAGFTGTPLPKDEPMAANPPDGAAIDYVLPAATGGAVTLTISDQQGRKVRSFTSTGKPQSLDPATLAFAPEWVPQKPVPESGPGMHRFYWDLHYATPAPSESPLTGGGAWAPPGVYTVVLDADGQSVRQSVTVKPDPRVNVPQAALVREFDLATKVEILLARDTAALKDARSLMKALAGRETSETNLRPQIVKAMAEISGLADLPMPSAAPAGRASRRRNPASFESLASDLAKLERAVDGADADPGLDSRQSYASLTKMLDSTLASWDRLKQADVASIDASLKAEGKKALNL
ncbi:MAG: WD40/YVTN/BNR-like repeat-containing protein [Rhizomicrobium sp.]